MPPNTHKYLAAVCLLVLVNDPAHAAKTEMKDAVPRGKADMEAATRLQIFLDRAEFAPGKIDGRYGQFTLKALALYRQSRGETSAPKPEMPATAPDVSGIDLTYQTLSSKVEEFAGRTKEYTQHAVDATKDAAQRATDTARDMYQSAALKAEDTLTASKEYVRQNPVLVVVGAIAFGAAIGCMLMMARRQPTLRERYVAEPLDSAREAILAALAPVAQRLHEGYDSVRDGTGKAMDRVHQFSPGRTIESLSGQIGRVGNNLKYW